MLVAAFVAALLFGLSFGSTSSRAAYTAQPGITYGNESPANPGLNQLDLYRPSEPESALAPLVIFVHGGGWHRGDKANANVASKARLFTDAGYFFASLNYRLSTEPVDVENLDPGRIRFPDHPADVGKAIGWLNDNALANGIDPDRIILTGHSAGAHLVSLVSTDPSYITNYGVNPRQVLGTVALDTTSYDIEARIIDGSDEAKPSYLSGIGTAEENAVDGSWAAASPINWADSLDPEHLFITSLNPKRLLINQQMAAALGQGPETVVQVPLNHAGINNAVGAPGDTSGTTAAISSFISARLASFQAPGVLIRQRPSKVVKAGWKRKKGKLRPKLRAVKFIFEGYGAVNGFECRIDKAAFKPCRTSRRYRLSRGAHSFRIRPLYPSGRPAAAKVFKFKVKMKRKPRR